MGTSVPSLQSPPAHTGTSMVTICVQSKYYTYSVVTQVTIKEFDEIFDGSILKMSCQYERNKVFIQKNSIP